MRMDKYPSPCEKCEKNSTKCIGCDAWRIRYRYRQKQINAMARRLVQPVVNKNYFCYSHPDDVREFLQRGPCVDCKAEQLCSIPCRAYWQWWDMRMAYMRRKLGL